jgi:hypothetical protein
MNEEYEKELSDLKYKMQKAESFAEKLPIFSNEILSRKLSSDASYIRFSERYKAMPLTWGLNRGLFETGTKRTVTNYNGDSYKEYLFSIYINTLSMYDSHENFGLYEIKDKVPIFFLDGLNSTFYATDDQVEGLLDALLAWYERAIKQIVEHNKEQEILKLTEKLERLKTTTAQ